MIVHITYIIQIILVNLNKANLAALIHILIRCSFFFIIMFNLILNSKVTNLSKNISTLNIQIQDRLFDYFDDLYEHSNLKILMYQQNSLGSVHFCDVTVFSDQHMLSQMLNQQYKFDEVFYLNPLKN